MQPMPPDFVVQYAARRFPAGVLPWNGTLRFTENDLAHALFTTGRAPGDQARFGDLSVWEFLHRTTLIPAYIRRRPYGELARSDLVHMLDRSELVGVSYALGMALTTVFCRTQLNVSHLLHVDRYANHHRITFNATTRKRADLIGASSTGWVVAEAKGRSRTPEYDLRDRLEEQKRSVSSVEGRPPSLALGCVAYFPEPARGIRIDAYDPSKDAEETVRYDDMDLDRFFFAYYLPFVRAISFGEATTTLAGSRDVEAANFRSFGLSIGLLRPIFDLTRAYSDRADVSGYADQIRDILAARPAGRYSDTVLSDGSWFSTSWTESIQGSDVWTEG